MTKVEVFWKGNSKSGNMYIGVSYAVKGFAVKKFVQVVDEEVFEALPESGEVEIPTEALS